MKTKRMRDGWSVLDLTLLCAAACFLAAAILRTIGTGAWEEARKQAAALVWGEHSAEEVIAAIGTWDDLHDSVVAVFGETKEQEPEDGFERDVLSERAAAFPDLVDDMTYLLQLPCAAPTVGTVTSSFGARNDPFTGERSHHYGLDIAAEEGTPIYAVDAGVVKETGENSYGKYLILEHASGFQSLYAHCSVIEVREGQNIAAGERIAAVGHTGRATGDHLHFELWRAGRILDPTPYLSI